MPRKKTKKKKGEKRKEGEKDRGIKNNNKKERERNLRRSTSARSAVMASSCIFNIWIVSFECLSLYSSSSFLCVFSNSLHFTAKSYSADPGCANRGLLYFF